jgi:formylglycine-generating enzyme required for sulfatase activity
MNKIILKLMAYAAIMCIMFIAVSCDDDDDNSIYRSLEQPADSFFNNSPVFEGIPLPTATVDMSKTGIISGDPIDDPEAMETLLQQRKQVIIKAINDMVYVDGSTFLMGATAEQGSYVHIYERTVRKVTLSSYYISKFHVTQELYLIVMGGTNQGAFKEEGNLNYPIDNRLFSEMQTFVTKFNDITGLQFALPTEAQWEFAARGGRKRTANTLYAGSNNLGEVANYWNNTERIFPGGTEMRRWPFTVGSKAPNELGLYDMSGNMADVCQDWYAPYSVVDETDPKGPASLPEEMLQKRVCRGGGWITFADPCRISARSAFLVTSRFNYLGFRLVHPKID